mgnify:CR=1 FL=1
MTQYLTYPCMQGLNTDPACDTAIYTDTPLHAGINYLEGILHHITYMDNASLFFNYYIFKKNWFLYWLCEISFNTNPQDNYISLINPFCQQRHKNRYNIS